VDFARPRGVSSLPVPFTDTFNHVLKVTVYEGGYYIYVDKPMYLSDLVSLNLELMAVDGTWFAGDAEYGIDDEGTAFFWVSTMLSYDHGAGSSVVFSAGWLAGFAPYTGTVEEELFLLMARPVRLEPVESKVIK
jgi:hypothetical protein